MSDEPTPLEMQEEPSPAKERSSSRSLKFMVVLGLILLAGGALVFSRLSSGTSDIATLKSEMAGLAHRVNHLESAPKVPADSVSMAQLKAVEAKILNLSEQIDAIRNQPKSEASFEHPPLPFAVESSIKTLTETQKIFKSVLLFWRLRSAVLSGIPYFAELAAFKAAVPTSENLEILEKYANQGLQAIKTSPQKSLPTPQDHSPSWWNRFKESLFPFIKVTKIGPLEPSSVTQIQQEIDEALTQLDRGLARQLEAVPLTVTSLSGDTL